MKTFAVQPFILCYGGKWHGHSWVTHKQCHPLAQQILSLALVGVCRHLRHPRQTACSTAVSHALLAVTCRVECGVCIDHGEDTDLEGSCRSHSDPCVCDSVCYALARVPVSSVCGVWACRAGRRHVTAPLFVSHSFNLVIRDFTVM